jgi:pyrroline-5-carboxylate reductase
MAGALARGWAASQAGPDSMLFTDAIPERAEALAAEVGGEVASSNQAFAGQVDLVVLATKPGQLSEVAAELGGRAPALLSILAATPLARVDAAFPGVPAVRVMPNLNVEVGRGVLCWAASEGAPAELVTRVTGLLGAVGETLETDEAEMDAVTAVMSSTPAYFALVVQSLADAGVEQGLEEGDARRLVLEAMAGTAELLRGRETAEVELAVASPGGATEAGLEALRSAGVPEGLAGAVRASMRRMEQLRK